MTTIEQRMKQDFDRFLQQETAGNYTVELIDDIGSGDPLTGGGTTRTRCVCFAKDPKQDPILRTSTDDPIHRGQAAYIPELERFYLITDDPQRHPNCYTAHATRCNAYLSVWQTVPAITDDYGMELEPETVRAILCNVPAITKLRFDLIGGSSGSAGRYTADVLEVRLQLNAYTAAVKPGAWFNLDDQRFTIYDLNTDAEASGGGIITWYCEAAAGARNAGS